MPLSKPVKVDFGEDNLSALHKYVEENIRMLLQSTKELRENKLAQWRKIRKGTPAVPEKNFPWRGASNIVIQVVGMHVDSLLAKLMAGIYGISPLWVSKLYGEWEETALGDEQRASIEEFMDYVALEPGELDLPRVEEQWFGDATAYGTSVIKFPWEEHVEVEMIEIPGAKPLQREFLKYEGPRVEKLPFESFVISNSASTLDSADFKFHIRPLKKHQLLERVSRGLYEEEKIEAIISKGPDRYGPSPEQKERDSSGSYNSESGEYAAEWDIYECWFPYFHNSRTFRIISSFHYKSRTSLRDIYNFYPKNLEPFEDAKLGYADDGYYGYGYAEMLGHYQEDVTAKHNRRNDNETLANTSILRVSKNSKLDSIFSIYPNALIPAEQDEIEKLQLGSNYPSSVEEEKLTLGLAESRSGVGQASSGGGGGVTNPRKGVYSAMGTFAVLQEGNSRSNLRINDMRMAHIRFGRKIVDMYAHFGVGEKALLFGKQADYLKMALESIKNKRIGLAIRPASGSVNKELEKQNDMLLTQVMQRHYAGVAQILQQINMPQMPPELKEYQTKVIAASQALMNHILRNFGHDDVSRLLPEPAVLQQRKKAMLNGKLGSNSEQGAGAGNPGNESGVAQSSGEQGATAATLPFSGMATGASIPQGAEGGVTGASR